MSARKWGYDPEMCDGEPCPGDCDLCFRWQNRVEVGDLINKDVVLFEVMTLMERHHHLIGDWLRDKIIEVIKDAPAA